VSEFGFAAAAAEKRRRGRPPAFTPEAMAVARSTGAKSRRAQQDVLYRLTAARLLLQVAARRPSATGRLSWLVDLETGRCLKPSVLVELGRMTDTRMLLRAALHLCEVQPSTKDAVAWLRESRLTS
jgi:hypothetical protein